MGTLSPEERSLHARMAAHVMHSQHDSRVVSEPARDAFMARFVDEVDPGRILSSDERARRAQHALKAHMLSLALKSASARRKGGDAG